MSIEAMNDRELLELAAKACEELTQGWYGNDAYFDGVLSRWNPLANDGDALRLAVKLDIDIYQADNDGPSVYAGYWHKRERRDVNRLFCIESTTQDPYAATRRAIVRAAAEIGKQRGEA